MTSIFRVHPAINFARVGNSEEYYIAPETAAGELLDKETGLFGGLPIKPGTEDTPITANDFRDQTPDQKVKRQAARFRIFVYEGIADYRDPTDCPPGKECSSGEVYPSKVKGKEVCIGDVVDGKTVTDIVWSVHLANKKNNSWSIESANGQEEGIRAYRNGQTPPIRNPSYGSMPNSDDRLRKLVIDAGPRTIKSSDNNVIVDFDAATPSTYIDNTGNIAQADYPVSFPADHFENQNPSSGDITTLGQMTIEPGSGRLIVVGGYGNAFAFVDADGNKPELNDAIDNDGWFDDVSDGPVNAIVKFDDGSHATVVAGWFVCTDPGYAPQIRNVVSTWDDVFNTWVEQLGLVPQLYSGGKYDNDYQASFYQDVMPVFHGAFLQRWSTNLPGQAVNGHNWVAAIQPSDDPTKKIPNFDSLIRDPNDPQQSEEGGKKMPLALGDAQKSFLSLTTTQYFLMKQWYAGRSTTEDNERHLGVGEKLDKVVLENCLGGRYSPGIDLTFIVRDINLYHQKWHDGTGPFRINQQQLDYGNANVGQPFLNIGYIPLNRNAVEPGDLSKFMAQPWHTDYNSCAVHEPDPNPPGNNTLYWSWPAQRPVQVHPADLCSFDDKTQRWNLGGQLFSVRGKGTETEYPQEQGRFQQYIDYLENWHKTGFVIQGVRVMADQGGNYGDDKFIEVASQYESEGDIVQPWPTSVVPEN
ncbi:hypothetical protein CHH28_10580 [Bacterioplanes sanyensis]|uniref:L-lysine 6-oxidase n=1 Tax=Bacterioplanes sanyensis TaxID=1249553 RepID=A0A222FKI6_9GAMM|nr:LodA/GoxA family CTQ-dependent oxidase [Bacterioplanes sanyensis]ASP39096.1 hypothetical protein CHH28_10580 [Bacterioplanes sanyensis]